MSKLYNTLFCGPENTEAMSKLQSDKVTKIAKDKTKEMTKGMTEVEKWELFKRMTSK
jgi:hypothetical protein